MIELRALLPDEIAPYFDGLWSDYRKELIAAGYSVGYVEENVQNNKKSVLPNGVLSPGNHIFYAYIGEDKVGKIWLTTR